MHLDANNLDIPDEVMYHPVVRSLGEAANDLVTWSNVSVPFVRRSLVHDPDSHLLI